jgi:hypothetical protein
MVAAMDPIVTAATSVIPPAVGLEPADRCERAPDATVEPRRNEWA